MIDTKELRKLAQAAITELLDRIEASESECLEQARLNGMGSEREAALIAKLEAAEKERDWNAERLEDAIEELTALRAKIEAMENQEPAAEWVENHFDGPKLYKLYVFPGAKGE